MGLLDGREILGLVHRLTVHEKGLIGVQTLLDLLLKALQLGLLQSRNGRLVTEPALLTTLSSASIVVRTATINRSKARMPSTG